MSDLRKKVIRLAYQNPKLRGELLPLLKTAEKKADGVASALDRETVDLITKSLKKALSTLQNKAESPYPNIERGLKDLIQMIRGAAGNPRAEKNFFKRIFLLKDAVEKEYNQTYDPALYSPYGASVQGSLEWVGGFSIDEDGDTFRHLMAGNHTAAAGDDIASTVESIRMAHKQIQKRETVRQRYLATSRMVSNTLYEINGAEDSDKVEGLVGELDKLLRELSGLDSKLREQEAWQGWLRNYVHSATLNLKYIRGLSRTAGVSRSVLRQFKPGSWFHKFFSEKDIPHKVFKKVDSQGLEHDIPNEVVIEHIAQASRREQEQIKQVLIKIDFHNGDVNHFLDHLAGAIAENYSGALR